VGEQIVTQALKDYGGLIKANVLKKEISILFPARFKKAIYAETQKLNQTIYEYENQETNLIEPFYSPQQKILLQNLLSGLTINELKLLFNYKSKREMLE
jgi:hypothetical protein